MRITVVGLGPGGKSGITPEARQALEACRVVAGYRGYLEQIPALIRDKEVISTGMTGELERCRLAVERALSGQEVCVVSGGDPGVYGMAGLVCQLAAEHPQLEVRVVPGVTAACAAAAALGAPLSHDFAVISLSDLLTDWDAIRRRVELAAQGDFVLCFYNPGSTRRREHLSRACGYVCKYRPAATPCGVVRDAARPGQNSRVCTLGDLLEAQGNMAETVIVGNSQTRILGGRLVTPRGYLL